MVTFTEEILNAVRDILTLSSNSKQFFQSVLRKRYLHVLLYNCSEKFLKISQKTPPLESYTFFSNWKFILSKDLFKGNKLLKVKLRLAGQPPLFDKRNKTII